jgi:AsmA protein
VKIQPLFHQQLEFSKVSIAALQVNQVQATAVGAKVKFQDQLLQIQPLTANFYQGILQSKVQISLKKASPVVQVVADLKNVDLASLMKSLSGEPGQLSFEGRATMTADVNTQGNKTEELLKHLNGSGSFSLDKGVMKGIDLAFYVETAAALINKQSLPTRLPHDQSEVGRLTGTAVIKNGVLYNTDLLLESPLFTTTGKGSINLVKKTLDYHLEVTPQAGQSNNALWALAGKKVPIHVSGYWNNPTVSLDTLALMQAIGKEQLQKVQEQIQKALPDKASKFIQNLFH